MGFGAAKAEGQLTRALRRFPRAKRPGPGACCSGGMNTPLSILDLAPIAAGADASAALHNSLDLARHAERWGYRRYWVAEHHNMPGIASAATAVVVGYIAGGTSTIRVGSGGVMLPNHAPLVIAEQFGTLEALYPGRIDLGLGRAPGTDPRTAQALRRETLSAETFPDDVLELQAYFGEPQAVNAVPGTGLRVPIWLLGSSLFSARLAARLGLPFAFASHFAPGDLDDALHIYRKYFEPSAALERPYSMAVLNVFAADTDADGARLMTSLQQAFLALRRGQPGRLPPPVDQLGTEMHPLERRGLAEALSCTAAGSPETVRKGIERFIERTRVNELMITSNIYDHTARLRSFEIVAELALSLAATAAAALPVPAG